MNTQKNSVKLSIIIPSYKRTLLLEALLKQIIAIAPDKATLNFEVIVVDDGSPNILEKERMLKAFDFPFPFTFLKQTNAGPASARNHGLKYAKGEFIAFLDDDALPQEHWIEQILKGYENSKVCGIAGRTLSVNERTIPERFLSYVEHLHAHQFSDKGHMSYVCTVNCSFQKKHLDEIKGFNEAFPFASGEDIDLSFRLRQKGYHFKFNEEALVHHQHRDTFYELYKTYFLRGRGSYMCSVLHKSFDTEHVTSKNIFEPKKVFITLMNIAKKFVSNFANPKLSFIEKLCFPLMEILSHVFYQLGRWYEKIFAKKPSNH